jgi:predicted kinase
LFEEISAALKVGRNVVLDNTNINRWERNNSIGIARARGIKDVEIIWLNMAKDASIRLNAGRSRVVPLKEIDERFATFEEPQSDEGRVTVLSPIVDLTRQDISERRYEVLRSDLPALS